MQYLKIKRRASGKRNEMYFVTARSKTDKNRQERYLSKKKNHLITGDADSGKTRILKRVYENRAALFGEREVFIFHGIDPIAEWLGNGGGNQRERLNNLIERISNNKALILFDDLHKLSGRKLQVAKEILGAAANYWITTITENRIPPTLRKFADDGRIEHLELDSAVAFDGTIGAVMLLVVVGVLAGHPELALMAGIGGLLANGRLGSSQKT